MSAVKQTGDQIARGGKWVEESVTPINMKVVIVIGVTLFAAFTSLAFMFFKNGEVTSKDKDGKETKRPFTWAEKIGYSTLIGLVVSGILTTLIMKIMFCWSNSFACTLGLGAGMAKQAIFG